MKEKKIIYIFGNPLVECDSMPIRMLPELEKEFPEIDFLIIDPNENLKPINKEMIIIDTVEGIDEVCVIDNIDSIVNEKKYSMHDLDLGFNLKLLHKLGRLDRVLIFGIPMMGNKRDILNQLIDMIKDYLITNLY